MLPLSTALSPLASLRIYAAQSLECSLVAAGDQLDAMDEVRYPGCLVMGVVQSFRSAIAMLQASTAPKDLASTLQAARATGRTALNTVEQLLSRSPVAHQTVAQPFSAKCEGGQLVSTPDALPGPNVEPQPTAEAADNATQMVELRAELTELKPSVLRKRAAAIGVNKEELKNAEDADDPTAALVDLVAKHERAVTTAEGGVTGDEKADAARAELAGSVSVELDGPLGALHGDAGHPETPQDNTTAAQPAVNGARSPTGLEVTVSAASPDTALPLLDSPSARQGLVEMADLQVVDWLGKGAVGRVYLVRQISSGKLYAVKTLSKRAMLSKKKGVAHVMQEFDILRSAAHPFVIKLYASFQSSLFLCHLMEFWYDKAWRPNAISFVHSHSIID
jgi:hypothetical protein